MLFDIDPASLDERTRLIEDLDADSVDFLDLALLMQEEFGLRFEHDEVLELFARLGRFLLNQDSLSAGSISADELDGMATQLTVSSLADFIISEIALSS